MFFAGDTWNCVGLECELPEVGSCERAWIGDKQVVVESRCAHCGGAICWKSEVKELTCPYHQWICTLKGDLMG